MKARKIVLTVSVTVAMGLFQNCYAANTGHTIIKIYLASGDPHTTLSEGKNLVDNREVHCPTNLTSCTLAMTIMNGLCAVSNVRIPVWEMLVTVDGTSVGEALPEPTYDSACVTGNWLGNFSFGPGSHSVKFYTYYSGDQSPEFRQGQWSVNYTVTTP